MGKKLSLGALAVLFVLRLSGNAANLTLKPETKAAWENYLVEANSGMQARLQPGAHFLWLDDEPQRAELVRIRGPYIGPVSHQNPRKVPFGLIHDWIGATFVPNARIDDLLRVVRDYDKYKDVYRPGVVQSVSHGTDGVRDLFSLRLVNKSVVSKTALDAESEATYHRVDSKHLYSVSNTIHIREVDKVGTPEERVLPEDQGSGLIWRLSSISRMEERDGGVYVEIEAIALSRDIPGALRVFVTPIVRRVSRDSLATSLHQTCDAVDAGIAHHELASAGTR